MIRSAILRLVLLFSGMLWFGLLSAQTASDSLIAQAGSVTKILFTDTTDQVKTSTNDALEKQVSGFLQQDESIMFTWDSIRFAKYLKSEDGSFAILSWVVPLRDHQFRYSGFIQKFANDRVDTVYRLIPLNDAIDVSKSYGAEKWPVAVYEKMLPREKKAGFYTMFGWVGKSRGLAGKVIETLAFDSAGAPVFGVPAFAMKNGTTHNRIEFEYTDEVPFHLAWERQLLPGEKRRKDHIIIFNRIGGNTPGMGRVFHGPVPSYEYFDAFAWIGDQWVFFEDVRPRANTKDLDDRPPKEMGLTPENK